MPTSDADRPLDPEYARSVVEHAGKLDRVQQMLSLLPDEFSAVVKQQPDDFLYGVAIVVQAMHDLMGEPALEDAARVLEHEEENLSGIRLAKALVGTYGLLGAMGFEACQEVVRRHE